MASLNLAEEKLLTENYSTKGKIFIYHNIIYSIYSEMNQTIRIYNNQTNSSYSIYSGKNVEIYDAIIQQDRLWICGKVIDDNVGFYCYSDYSSGMFQTIDGWTEPVGSDFIYQLFIVNDILHYIQISSSSGVYYITMKWNTSSYSLYSDPYCSFKDVYYDGDLYLFVETVDPVDNYTYIKIFHQQNYTPSTGMTSVVATNVDDANKNVMFFDVCVIEGEKYMLCGKAPFIQLNSNTVVANEVCLYHLILDSISTSFSFPNMYFQSVTHMTYNGRHALIGYLYLNVYHILRYFYISMKSNATLMNNVVYTKISNYPYLSNDRSVEYVVKDDYFYVLAEMKSTLNQEFSNVVQTKLSFQMSPQASMGSDPHIYPLFSKPFDMLQLSTRKWYSMFEMGPLKISAKFVGLKSGVFFHKVKVDSKEKKIEIDFNKKMIKGEKVSNVSKLAMKYKNTTFDKTHGDYLNTDKLKLIPIDDINYPLSLYVDFKTRYLHFFFDDKIPSSLECSGLIV